MASVFFAAGASAASLQKVAQSDWWSGASGLPSYVNMYTYVPDHLAAKPPIVVAPHHCQGTAQSTFSEMASLVSIADKTGFLLIFPEATGENCWDAGSSRSLTHGGGGDTGAVVQMVKYALAQYMGDAGRVYSVGGSSGGIMTEALLGVYSDVFIAGVSLMGVPCGCWADGYNDVTGTGSTAQWSAACANGDDSQSGQAWGDLVRSYYPGYTGHRPRLQHWHGTADTTIAFTNLAEDVKEWTNLLGLSETPTGSDTPSSGTAHQFWKNACGYTVYETFALSGVGHAVPFDGNAVASYFGLDKATTADPETAACGSGSATGGSGGGSAGAAGGSTTGAGGMSGSAASAGRAGSNAGGTAGGIAASGGGGASSVGGNPSGAGNAGTSTSSGQSAGGNAAAAAGSPAAAAGVVGSSGAPQGGATGRTSGDAAGQLSAGAAGDRNSGGTQSPKSGDTRGCSCFIAGSTSGGTRGSAAVIFAALALIWRRRSTPRSKA